MLRYALAFWLALAPAWADGMAVPGVPAAGQDGAAFNYPPTVSAGGGFTGLGDAVAQTAYGYWGIREYKASYGTGNAIIVCDAATFATCSTINYLSTGYVDAATAAGSSACAVACVVKQIFDSTGNGHNATCAAAATCFTLTFSCHGTFPCFSVTAAGPTYALATTTALVYPTTASFVGQRTTRINAFGGICCSTAAGGMFESNNANEMQLFSGGTAGNFTVSDGAWHAVQGITNGTSSSAFVDGTNTPIATSPGTGAGTIDNIGNANSPSLVYNFEMLELAMYNNVAFSSTDWTNANTNQHAAYGGL